jgi:hypothetical protein
MARWPVFVWRAMHEDRGCALRLRQEVTWDVLMVDGVAAGWPDELLVERDVEIVALEDRGRPALIARTDDLVVCWGGASPAGSRFRINASLTADFFNPPISTPVGGVVRSIYLAIPGPTSEEAGPAPGVNTWSLTAHFKAPPSLGAYTDLYSAGLLVELDLRKQSPLPG